MVGVQVYFWAHSVPLIHVCFCTTTMLFQVLQLCSIVGCLKDYASCFAIFLQYCFSNSGILWFYMNFRIICSNPMKNVMGNLIGIAYNLWIAWVYGHLNTLLTRDVLMYLLLRKSILTRDISIVHLYNKLPSTGGGGGSGVQLPSCVRLFETQWTTACQASLILTIS